MKEALTAVRLMAAFGLLAGVIYPAVVTGIAYVAFPYQAHGSVVVARGVPIGSALIGQAFADPKYFRSRPSPASPVAYCAYDRQTRSASGGTNFGPTTPALAAAIRASQSALGAESANLDAGMPSARMPTNLVTTSASGLDPEITVASAMYQTARVAHVRKLPANQVRSLVRSHARKPLLGCIGVHRVNVLELNLALDSLTRRGADARRAQTAGRP